MLLRLVRSWTYSISKERRFPQCISEFFSEWEHGTNYSAIIVPQGEYDKSCFERFCYIDPCSCNKWDRGQTQQFALQ